MIKTYLINLDRSPERLAFMQGQFEALGLTVERIPAIDGKHLDLAPFRESGLTPSEIGCFLSHRAAWEKLAASRDSHALVLEDDVRLSAAVPKLLNDSGWIPNTGEIIKLDTSERRIGVTRTGALALGHHALHLLRTSHTGAAAYILPRSAALSLLDRSIVLKEPVDLLLFGPAAVAADQRAILQLIPAAVVQERRLTQALPAGLQSLIIPERRTARLRGFMRVRRNVIDTIRKAGTLLAQQYRARVQDIRYLRVPFRQDA